MLLLIELLNVTAVEGIKYSLAASKNKYQRFPVGAKKGEEQSEIR
jgi:hypothetical protein